MQHHAANNLAVHITFSNQSSRRKVICYPSGILAIPRTTTRLNEPCQLRIQTSNGFVHFSTNQRGNNNKLLLLPENQILQTPNLNDLLNMDINESAPVCSIPSAHKGSFPLTWEIKQYISKYLQPIILTTETARLPLFFL